MLEPCEGKLSRTVLRGESGSNTADLLDGYLSQTREVLTPEEISLLAFSAKLMTMECGIRFLTDYLQGDVYFKIHRPDHNLDRSRTQMCLVADMEKKLPQMEAIVEKCR